MHGQSIRFLLPYNDFNHSFNSLEARWGESSGWYSCTYHCLCTWKTGGSMSVYLEEGRDPAVRQCLDSVVHAVSHPWTLMSNHRVKRLFWSRCAHPGKLHIAPQSYHKGVCQLPEEVKREQSSRIGGMRELGRTLQVEGTAHAKAWPPPGRTLENSGRPLECLKQESDISGLCSKRTNKLL